MYNVVIGTDWCSVVPDSWIDKDIMSCLWPPNTTNITKLVKEQVTPDISWKSTLIKYILRPYGNKHYVYYFIVLYS